MNLVFIQNSGHIKVLSIELNKHLIIPFIGNYINYVGLQKRLLCQTFQYIYSGNEDSKAKDAAI